ncbi:MAG: hypothetical protein IJN36_06570, partial [Clostridia bacterium]|nr:hypothetical protein [Clostridia bacterium]
NGNIVNLDIAQKIGGWVEELDRNFNVINVYGEKRTDNKFYTPAQLLDVTSSNGRSEYIGFFIQREKVGKTFLCLYRRDVMSLNPTLVLNKVGLYGTPDISLIFFPLAVIEMVLISLYLKKKIKKPLDKLHNSIKNGQQKKALLWYNENKYHRRNFYAQRKEVTQCITVQKLRL